MTTEANLALKWGYQNQNRRFFLSFCSFAHSFHPSSLPLIDVRLPCKGLPCPELTAIKTNNHYSEDGTPTVHQRGHESKTFGSR